MHIEHIGLWGEDLEAMKDFYQKYFGGSAGELYHNTTSDFKSYFLSFSEGARLEIMTRPDITRRLVGGEILGLTHLAIRLGSKEAVDSLVERLVKDGFPLLNGPRTTGDGYYEAVVKDLEGNLVELMM